MTPYPKCRTYPQRQQQEKLNQHRLSSHHDQLNRNYHPHHYYNRHHYNYHQRWLPLLLLLFAPSFFISSSSKMKSTIFCHAIGYSYARFMGPVIGPEREIIVNDELNGGTRIDYIARPDYQFAYGVEDSEMRVLQNRKETRSGDVVKGVYSVVDPDGVLRVVKYTADDENGFQAEVTMDGVSTIHGQSDGNGANWQIATNDGVLANYAQSQNYVDDSKNDDTDADGHDENDYEVHEENADDDSQSANDHDEGPDDGANKMSNKFSAEEFYDADGGDVDDDDDVNEEYYSSNDHADDDDNESNDDDDDNDNDDSYY